jgi:hypothetical protein
VKVVTIYRRDTGRIVGHYAGSERNLAINVPDGCSVIPGRHDPESQRINPETEQAEDWQPPPPNADVLAKRKRRAAQASIARLEEKQHRRVRELLAETDPTLRAIDAEIVKLRTDL